MEGELEQGIDPSEAAVVRAALGQGFVTSQQVREALLIRDELSQGGTRTSLLRVLGSRFLDEEQKLALTTIYYEAQRGGVAAPQPPRPPGNLAQPPGAPAPLPTPAPLPSLPSDPPAPPAALGGAPQPPQALPPQAQLPVDFGPPDPGAQDVGAVLMASEDELAIPEFVLQRSSNALKRPVEEDPADVQAFLIASHEGLAPPLEDFEEEAEEEEEDEGGSSKGSGIWNWLRGKR